MPDHLQRRIRELGPWFHNLRLNGIETAPDHFLGDYPQFKWQGFRHVLPQDMRGMTVLDIGCNAGFYAMEMARRGADRVLGIDSDPRYLAQARLAAETEGLRIEFRELSAYDVAQVGERFDLVIFMGVFYHLRHPLLALDRIREHVAGDRMLFQSMQRGSRRVAPLAEDHAFDDPAPFTGEDVPLCYFIENRFAGDPTNWFVPNRAGMEAMLRSAGFRILEHPEPEVYLCGLSERG
ncbi:TIGR04290 family methyltransferase [Frigidibacter oleivorans]|uniref:TIGR04290 family methyltransferase n=1 Tax=Frigidibacter oleivorans TaxID=2487129 RepID=UPI000F8D3493|nr:TIGR04290 family methyltransferase [Frigidibacter oleivorans]